ncbi:MAG: excinuclease ABC subunit UvrA [Bacteroidetes bacterium]|nr:excinuclease ABC subunit UvrA [Bacteroidota bacterium]
MPNLLNKDPKKFIIIKGARQHNLKNIDLAITRNNFTVITGVSGSGKSSLAFDTLYAEGQRRYVESLSAYARQFLGRLEKPQVDYIKGISPAIAIEQKVISRNPRSTVGTVTEIYDYLKLLYARVGRTYSPISGKEVRRHSVSDVVNYILSLPEGQNVLIATKINSSKNKSIEKQLDLYSQQGFSRVIFNNEINKINALDPKKIKSTQEILLLIDRLIVEPGNDDFANRTADSVDIAFTEGAGVIELWQMQENGKYAIKHFSNLFEADGMAFETPDLKFFSFNNPVGACKLCEGFGSIVGIDPDLVIPNKSLSMYEGAIACWNGEAMSYFKKEFLKNAHKFNFPVHKPYINLSEEQKKVLWSGNSYFEGINTFFKHLEKETYKIQYRVMLARYRGKTNCPDCNGTRLRKDASYVKINNKHISELVLLPVSELLLFFNNITLNEHDAQVAKRLLIELNNRISYLIDVGLGYLTLNRLANTLSGGESQRISLATQLGSSLVGSLYILDEPSIGLHSRDTQKLISVLKKLQKQGNTIIVVEHDEDIMRAADELIDIGPEAGFKGGELVFQGNHQQLLTEGKSLTAYYLTNKLKIEAATNKRKWTDFIEIKNLNENNLKNLSVKFPLNVLCCVTGVSGSGKSTLIKKGLVSVLQKQLEGYFDSVDASHLVAGAYKKIKQLEYIDQNPIGKSSRSNPVTYIKAYDDIRTIFSEVPLSRVRNFKPGFFSFNVEGGRCETCQGEGEVTIEMQFMANIQLTCEACKGKRFKEETLEINYRGKNIYDVLTLTVDEAVDFFSEDKKDKTAIKVVEKLNALQSVGLGYVQLGQSSSTLSGGEAQRIKLSSFLTQINNSLPTLFVFDEPTTGLHFNDVAKLLKSFNELIKRGHSIVVIEHNLDVVKCADWIIDLGPEGGEKGGNIVFEGTPEHCAQSTISITGQFLSKKN